MNQCEWEKQALFSQPSIYIDGWLYAMSMTSVVCKGLGKNGPGKNGPGKNGPEKTVRGIIGLVVESVKTARSFR